MGDRRRKRKYPSVVRRSGRLMQSESVSIMEKAEHNATRKSLETSTSVDAYISESSVLGTSLVKVIFASDSSENIINLGSKCGMLLNANQYNNTIDEVELIKGIERERAQTY